jgi:hypothetical protein
MHGGIKKCLQYFSHKKQKKGTYHLEDLCLFGKVTLKRILGKWQTMVMDQIYLSKGSKLVSVVCCQVEVSATSWSLVQRNPTECSVSKKCVIVKPQ